MLLKFDLSMQKLSLIVIIKKDLETKGINSIITFKKILF